MFFSEFREKHRVEYGSSRRIESSVKQAFRRGIDGGVQPILLVTELDHGFVDRNAILVCTVKRLYIVLSQQLWTVVRKRSKPKSPRIEAVSASERPARWSRIPRFIDDTGVASRSTMSNSKQSLSPIRWPISVIDLLKFVPPHSSILI